MNTLNRNLSVMFFSRFNSTLVSFSFPLPAVNPSSSVLRDGGGGNQNNNKQTAWFLLFLMVSLGVGVRLPLRGKAPARIL